MTSTASTSRIVTNVAVLIGLIVVCFGVGGLGAMWTAQGLREWYPTLLKPSWNPPSWVFGPVWSTLYVMMAVAAWLVWQKRGERSVIRPLALFAGQLMLNLLWSLVFFGMQAPGLAFGEIVTMWAAILLTVVAFGRVSRLAQYLLLPYFAWVSFAAFLNFTIWRLNVG